MVGIGGTVDAEGRGDGRRARGERRTPVTEWIASGMGAILFLGTLGMILYEGIFVAGSPPDVRVEIRDVARQGEGWLVRVKATNLGGATAAEVRVTGRLRRGDETVEDASILLDYLPGHSEREGGLFFRGDPESLVLDLRAEGYVEP
ncbi:hypothetical protein [Arenibaculum pallidiluteum]|uniref:hypothetical protein n=1 Tax=Arenibaculum pallidiluteum TaxID=2812559 RepID=UPI001A957B1E|nr:hypothetical protein [Arenibaculum pallidiluteum]